ncbi:hypothetical protein NCAS_0H02410 [Naumovozyma castellii]|uniref:Uncharacterized protein n=1 Tax=Naumovozyma castellii TaxID=27288 RepID=G0VJ72_NAUCA|nr:hypothetical protein NCAS_0H02410 [Naumovozyma castellii CBS 4309]CCC71551.1 hypothetical protein NCAS_0H02410 [Naumovozyma castellii CBS 4309]
MFNFIFYIISNVLLSWVPLILTIETIQSSKDMSGPNTDSLQQAKHLFYKTLLQFWILSALFFNLIPYSPIRLLYSTVPFSSFISTAFFLVLTLELISKFHEYMAFTKSTEVYHLPSQFVNRKFARFKLLMSILFGQYNSFVPKKREVTFHFGNITEFFITIPEFYSLPKTSYINESFVILTDYASKIIQTMFSYFSNDNKTLKKEKVKGNYKYFETIPLNTSNAREDYDLLDDIISETKKWL